MIRVGLGGDTCLCSAIVIQGDSKSRGWNLLKDQLLVCLAFDVGCRLEVSVSYHSGLSLCPLWASSQHGGWLRSKNPKKEPGRSYFTFSYLALEMMSHHFCCHHSSTQIQKEGPCTLPLNRRVSMHMVRRACGMGVYCGMAWPSLKNTIRHSHLL